MKQTNKASSADDLFKSTMQKEKQKKQSQPLLLQNKRQRKPLQQQRKQVSFEMDGKSCVTESTASFSIRSEPSGENRQQTSAIASPRRREGDEKSSVFRDKREASSQSEPHNMSKLIHSNHSLRTENITMKKDMRKMKARMTVMETSLQLSKPQKEKELVGAIEALNRVKTKQAQKIDAYETSKKKLKQRISQRDAEICQLAKGLEELRTASASTQRKFLSKHKEVTSLQQELLVALHGADEFKTQLERENDLNRDLTSRVLNLESQL